MDTQPLVSIGIPTYNRPEGLRRTLECITQQTYENLEIIVSDNCSPDPEEERVANEFKNKDVRIHYFRQSANIGGLKNFEFVLKQSTGKYFKWIADDDWIDLNYVESCVNFLTQNTDYSAAYGYAKLYNNQNEYILDDTKVDMDQTDSRERVKCFFRHILYNSPFYGIVRKENIDLLKLTNRLADDWLIVARIAFIGKIKLIENTNCYLTQGGSSKSFDNLVKALNLPNYVKHIPYTVVFFNIIMEIVWGSYVYRNLHFFKRMILALECSKIIWKRYNGREEIKKILIILIRKTIRFPGNKFHQLVQIINTKYRSFVNNRNLRKEYKNTNHEQIFTEIYQNKIWGSDDKSKFYSGVGSDFKYSYSYIQFIRKYINENKISTVVDLGCGDFRIGNKILENLDIEYNGIDVVDSLIEYNNKHFSKPGIRFTKINIARDKLPKGDLCLIRQVLQHLSNNDIQEVLKKTKKYEHLIITEHLPLTLRTAPNLDKSPDGDIRYSTGSGIYLDMPPFNRKIQEILRVEPLEHPGSVIVTYKVVK